MCHGSKGVMTKELLDHFQTQWSFVRGLTKDLLEVMSEEELAVTPNPKVGPWWKQFRHMGRVQENYLNAVHSGEISFGFEGCSYSGGPSGAALSDYLNVLDGRMADILAKADLSMKIDWFGENKSLAEHFLSLSDHEVLHHGQWIVYRLQLGGRFPRSWEVWGL
jgi:uncharacterized damage-inducible protein DinB